MFLIDFLTTLTVVGATTGHTWELINDKSWHITDVAQVTVPLMTSTYCGTGMIHVTGLMKQDDPQQGSVEALQSSVCTKWLPPYQSDGAPKFPQRCAKFDETKWQNIAKTLQTKQINVCIDQFEYPNKPGEYPVIFVDYDSAQKMCNENGKRLCTEEEWTFACEGPDALPYPYGYVRDAEKCRIDKQWRPYSESAMWPRNSERAAQELDRLWQGSASGEHPDCRSVFNVYDMTGNVDEFTNSPSRKHGIALKGGYFSTVRNRCRPATVNHDKSFYFYQAGFRCCRNPSD